MKAKLNRLVAAVRRLEAIKTFPKYFDKGEREKAEKELNEAYDACL